MDGYVTHFLPSIRFVLWSWKQWGQGLGDRGQGLGDRGQGLGDRGQGLGDRGQGLGDRGQYV